MARTADIAPEVRAVTPEGGVPTEPAAPHMHVRFAATLLANIVRAAASFAGGAVVARALGAADYGDLNFLLASFTAFIPLLDAGTSAAFFTFLSRERRGSVFFAAFAAWLGVQAVVPVLLIMLLLPDRLMGAVWLEQPRAAVLLAFAYVFLNTQVWGAVSRLGEARRLTIRVQGAAAAQAIGHLVLVVVAARLGWLTVNRTIALLAAEFAILCLLCAPRLVRENLKSETTESWRSIAAAAWAYCKPLLVYCWVGVPYAFADRWMLQAYAGSAAQGHFAFAAQFANLSLLATSSILSVFWKEVVDARERGDTARVRALHGRVTRSLYCVSALLSCALIPYSADILRWIVGPEFESAALVLALLLAYPIHQSLGQIQGTFLYASADTRTYATIGVVMMVVSIPVTYLLLGPRAARVPGLELGATGLALKMVGLQFLLVNLQAWFIARKNGWSLDMWHQVLTLAGLLALSFLARWGAGVSVTAIVGEASEPLIAAVGLALFGVLSLVGLLRWPAMAGVSSDDLRRWSAAAKARLAS